LIKFYDPSGESHFGQATITRTTSVNGGLSLTGEVFAGDDVLNGLDYGWWLNFDNEKYVITYKKLSDDTNTIVFDAVQQFFWDFAKVALHSQYTGSHEYTFYLNQLFNGSGYTYNNDATVPAFEKENWGYKNKLSLFNDIMDQADVEFEVHNETVHIAKQIGSDLTSFVRKGINLSDLTEEMKISDFATYAKGYGAFKDSDDQSKGRLEVEYRSELAKKFGDLEMDPIVDERYTVANNLIAELKKQVDATYTVSMTMNIYDLENAGYPNYESPKVGDWILAIDEALKFKRKVRIIKLEEQFDVTGKRIGYTTTCGDLSIVDQYTNIQSSLDNKVQRIQENVDNVAASADGKSSNYYGAKEPASANEGDLWFDQSNSDPDKWSIKQWANGRWEQLTLNPGEVDAKVSVAKQAADTAIENANSAVNTANDAVAKAGFANDTATQAKSDAATALQKALDAYNHGDQIKTGLTADIDAVKGQVSLKASQSDVDKLGGRVTNAEAQIKLQADQIALTVSKTELTNILGDYATETWTQSQIKSTADSINLSVSRVQSNLDNLSIGARNYLADTDTPWQTRGSGGTNQVSLNKWLFTFGTIKQAPFKDGEYVTVSFDYTNVGTGAYGNIYPRFNNAPWGSLINGRKPMKDNGHVVYTTPWQSGWTTSGTANGIQIHIDNVATTRTVTVYNMQFERGNKDTDWKQAPEDMATVEKLSELQVTVNGIQGTVQNKADQSQVTQMAGQITSLIGSANNPNLIPNSGLPKDTLFWRVNDTARFKVATHAFYTKGPLFALLAPQGTAERTAGTAIVSVTRGATYTASLGVFGDSNVFGCDVLWIGRKHGETTDTKVLVLAGNFKPNPSKIEFKSWAFNVGDCDEGYIRVDNNGSTSGESTLYFGEVKLEKGGRYTPWEQTAESSEIVQTREMINLRVQKGDVINQINISPESILIAGQKVHITGQTSIDNAVIKDAMIADIKADKITAGTLNAANVNVINLNANNITTGTIKGANLSMNLNTGEVLFQKGSIKSSDGTFAVDIDNRTITSTDNSHNGIVLKHGELLFYKEINAGSGSAEFGRMDVAFFNGGGLNITGYNGLTLGTETTGLYEANLALVSPKNNSGKSSASLVGDVIYLQPSPGNLKGEINISGKTDIAGSVSVVGDFSVIGKKNAIHLTNDGIRETPAYETAESYLGDIGEGVTDESGRALIHIDALFNQIINTDYDYQVFVSSYSNATIWVEERNATCFEGHSNIPNVKFAWEIKAKRRGYETDRLVKSEMKYEQLNKYYEKKALA